MAKITDAFRDIITDEYAVLKLVILSVPTFIITKMLIAGNNFVIYLDFIFGLIYLGFMLETAKRFAKNETILIPSIINPLPILKTLVEALIAVIPSLIISILLGISLIYLTSLVPQFQNPLSLKILYVMISYIISAFILTGLLLYLNNSKIKDAYNLLKIFKNYAMTLSEMILYTIQSFLLNLLIVVAPAYGIFLIFGTGDVLYFWIGFSIVLNYLIFGNYLAQIARQFEF